MTEECWGQLLELLNLQDLKLVPLKVKRTKFPSSIGLFMSWPFNLQLDWSSNLVLIWLEDAHKLSVFQSAFYMVLFRFKKSERLDHCNLKERTLNKES